MDIDKVRAEANKVQAASEMRRAEIRQRPHLSDQGRKVLLAKEVQACTDELDKLRRSALEQNAAERANLERAVWANPGGDLVGYRDAMGRVAAVADRDQAVALFRSASLSGDRQLQRALALDRRWRDVTASYADEDAEWAKAAEALRDFDRSAGSARDKMALSVVTAPVLPPELSGADPYEVARLARFAEATG